MEELRTSIRLKEEENFNVKKSYLIDAMRIQGYLPDEKLSSSMHFIEKIKLDNSHLLWQILFNSYYIETDQLISIADFQSQEAYKQITVECFVNQCLEALKRFHLEIFDHDNNIQIAEANSSSFKEVSDQLNKESTVIDDYENVMHVAYFKDKAYLSDIFKYFRIKYKVQVGDEEQLKSMFSHTHPKKCTFPIDAESREIVFVVQGKIRNEKDNDDEEEKAVFNDLSRIPLPFLEIITAIQPKNFILNNAIVCYLVLMYMDESGMSSYKQETSFEVQFEMLLDKAERINIIKKLLMYYDETIKVLQESVQKKFILVNQAMLPFIENVVYVRGQGLNNKKKERGACESCMIQ